MDCGGLEAAFPGFNASTLQRFNGAHRASPPRHIRPIGPIRLIRPRPPRPKFWRKPRLNWAIFISPGTFRTCAIRMSRLPTCSPSCWARDAVRAFFSRSAPSGQRRQPESIAACVHAGENEAASTRIQKRKAALVDNRKKPLSVTTETRSRFWPWTEKILLTIVM